MTSTGCDYSYDSTAKILIRVQNGDKAACDELVRRFLPRLRGWARGQVPPRLRSVTGTDDLVQDTFMKALSRVSEFKPGHRGAFFAYLRRVLTNQIRDRLRQADRRIPTESILAEPQGGGMNQEDTVRYLELRRRYEAALEQLTPKQRAAIMLNRELGFTHQEVADTIECGSANAARMLVKRGLEKLTEVLDVN